MSGPVLVELCAGSAAVSMWALSKSRPLTGYAGGKGKLARVLAEKLEIWDRPSRVVLVDPGPWGRVWAGLRQHRGSVQALLDDWSKYNHPPDALKLRRPDEPLTHRLLYDWIRTQPVPPTDAAYIARFLTLQRLNWCTKAVTEQDGAWQTAGYSPTMGEGVAGTDDFSVVRPQLPVMATLLRRLQHLDRIEGHPCSALEVEPIPGATVLIDPPYRGTTGYGPYDLTREELLVLADRWMAAGCRVAICEAEPIPGWRAVRVGTQPPTGGLSGTGKGREEWLSIAWRATQLSLL